MPEETTPLAAPPTVTTAILWRTELASHYWLVDASLDAKGNVSICSGDQRHEWYAIVAAEHVARFQSALADGGDLGSRQSVLDQLVARFGNRDEDSGPFEEIKRFLDAHAIPWKSESW